MQALIEVDHPPPRDGKIFQELAIDLYKKEKNTDAVEAYGSPGQAQWGVDVIVRLHPSDKLHCVQCKRVKKFSPKELKTELQKTENFPGKIAQYDVLLSTKRDTRLQDAVTMLSCNYNFPIKLRFWDDIASDLVKYEDLTKKYLPYAIRYHIESSQSVAYISVTVASSCYEFVVTKLSSLTKYSDDKDLVLLTSLQGQKAASFYRLGHGGWTNFLESVVPFKRDAYIVWQWFSRFDCFEDIIQLSGNVAVKDLDTEDLKRANDDYHLGLFR